MPAYERAELSAELKVLPSSEAERSPREQIVGIAEKPPSEPPQPGSRGYSGIGRLEDRRET